MASTGVLWGAVSLPAEGAVGLACVSVHIGMALTRAPASVSSSLLLGRG